MSTWRRPTYFNPDASAAAAGVADQADLAGQFHKQLPGYKPTSLVKLDDIASELGVGSVYLKDETSRFGLPSFKILGASWGSFRALAQRLNIPLDVEIETLKKAIEAEPGSLTLYAATDGNHGRAVARMGASFNISSQIHVPSTMNQETIELVRSEGATVVISTGSYDKAVLEAQKASEHTNGILIQDFAFGDYDLVPQASLCNVA